MHISLFNRLTLIAAGIMYVSGAYAAESHQPFMQDAKRQMDAVRLQIERARSESGAPANKADLPMNQGSYISQVQMLTQQASEIRENADSILVNPSAAANEEISKKALAIRNKVLTKPPSIESLKKQAIDANGEVLIFASFGMPDFTMRSVLVAAAESAVKTTIVFRGLKDESVDIRDASRAIRQAIVDAGLDKSPHVIIDPRLFNTYSIDVAPTMLFRQGGKVVTATGLESIEDFVSQSKSMIQSGSLGTLSDTYNITEMDMLELIQKKLKTINWEDKKGEAIQRFVNRKEVALTESAKDEDVRYRIDPRVRFTKDQTTPDGKYFAKAGDVVDPTALLTFETRLLMVDPSSEHQLKWLNDELKTEPNKQIYILLSSLPAGNDLTEFGRLQTKFGRRLYLMQPNMITRFKLQHLPVRVDLLKGEIRVTEIGQRALNSAGLPALLVEQTGVAK